MIVADFFMKSELMLEMGVWLSTIFFCAKTRITKGALSVFLLE